MYIKDKDGNYVPTPSSKGADGREVSLRVANNYIQWRYPDTEWTNLVALSELKGEQGDKGTVGAHFTPSVSDDGVLSWTNNGGLGNPQPVNIRGPQGVQGEQGRGFTILGYYDTLAILQSSVLAPNGGDAYGVGTTPPYEIYIWDAVNGQWKPNGKLSGPNEVTSSTATNLTGLLKGNGTSVVAATAGTDYATPDDAKGTATSAVSNHNSDASAHSTLLGAKQDKIDVMGVLANTSDGMVGYNFCINDPGENYSASIPAISLVIGMLNSRAPALPSSYTLNDMVKIGFDESTGALRWDVAVKGVDYLIPPYGMGTFPTSGTALAANTMYIVSAAVGTYVFVPPASGGWAHGIFTAGTSPNITFSGTIIGKLPTFEANKKYEFDVYDSTWIVQEVVTQ